MPDVAPPTLPDLASLWDHQDHALSEERFRAVLPEARAAGQPGYLCELLTQLARAVGRQRRFDEAHALLDEAEALLPPGIAGGERARVRCLLERGRVFNSSGRAPQSIPLFQEAWELARAAGEDGLAVDAAHMLGIVEEPERALEWNHRTIELVEQSEDSSVKGWLGPLYNNTGWTYFDRADYPRALELLLRAEEWYLGRGNPAQIRIARYSVAKTHRMLGRVEEAFSVQRALAAELAAADSEDGYVDEELGECLLALGRPAEARPHFRRAAALLSQDTWLAEHEPDRISRLEQLGVEPASP